ncbi:hypothetical protein ACFRI7_08275 [Streptomyces sp. NPDC056716]|uniref:hypothetical protein n=1 Tax=unclassified Streptomyces TaxID=2593676 RepID=UPI0036B4B658
MGAARVLCGRCGCLPYGGAWVPYRRCGVLYRRYGVPYGPVIGRVSGEPAGPVIAGRLGTSYAWM